MPDLKGLVPALVAVGFIGGLLVACLFALII